MVIKYVNVTYHLMITHQNIRLSIETKTKLEALGHKGETFDEIVNRLVEVK